MKDLKSSLVWKKFEPKRKNKIMDKYKNRFVMVLSPSKRALYLSDKVLGQLVRPDYVEFNFVDEFIGLKVAVDKGQGLKVNYKGGSAWVNVEGFIKEFERETKLTVEPGVYEGIVETIDAQRKEHYDLIVFDTTERPSKTKVEKENDTNHSGS